MKHTYMVVACGILLGCLQMNNAQAQLQKGNIMVGADLAGMTVDFQKDNTVFNMSITPKIGFFIQDNIAIGGEIGLGLTTGDGFTTFTYSIGPFGRYYLSDKRTQLLKQSRFFLEGNAGFRGQNTDVRGGSNTSTNGLGIGFGPGLAYFITQNIGLEALLKYNLTVGFGNSTTNSQLGFGLGFQIYLPTKKARAIYDDAKDQMRK